MRVGLLSESLFTLKGGRERFCANLVHALCARGHECVVFHQGSGKGNPLYELPEGVQTYDLALNGTGSLSQGPWRTVRKAKVDLLCHLYSSESALWGLFLCKGSGIPLLMSERDSPCEVERLHWNRSERLACLAAADGIHLLSPSYLPSLPAFLRERTTIIPNPAPAVIPVDWDKDKSPRKRLLTVARLEDIEKNISQLILAFAMLAEEFPDWDCCICGGGGNHSKYAEMIAERDLGSRIQLAGVVDHVARYYVSSHLFCLPSASEGFPNALLEAQAHGLPAVGFAGCSGVNEIIVHGENGILAEEMTPESLAAALRPLMKSHSLRRTMGQNGQSMLSRYDAKAVFDQWEALLLRSARARNRTRIDNLNLLEDTKLSSKLHAILARPHPFARIEEKQQNPRISALASLFRSRRQPGT